MRERQVLRGFIASIDVVPPLIVNFQFNPSSISDNKKVTYADGKADLCGNSPGKVYTSGGDRTISFDIELHGLEKGTNSLNPEAVDNGISTELAKLRSFLYPKEDAWAIAGNFLGSDSGQKITSPPSCLFCFGTKVLECIVSSMTVNEQQFNSMLAPVRAKITLTLIVNEQSGNGLYELDKQHRNTLAALGSPNISFS